jgi:hypothetical protein
VAAGALVSLMEIDYSSDFFSPTVSSTASGNFFGFGFGAQGQAGLDVHLGDYFVLSAFGGYQAASVSSLSSQVTLSSYGSSTGSTVQMYVVPTSNGNVITMVSNGTFVVPVADGLVIHTPGTPGPPGSSPLNVDLSGPYAGLMFSVYF